MLEKILEFEEKRKEKKKAKSPKMLEIYLIILGIAIIFVLINSIFSDGSSRGKNSDIKPNLSVENVNEYFSNIKNNYNMSVKVSSDLSDFEFIYETDGKFEGFEIDKYNLKYFKYNDKFYTINKNQTNIVRYNDNVYSDTYINSKFYDLEFIKNIFNKCEYKYKSRNITECNIKFNDLLSVYNNLYSSSYSVYDDKTIVTMLVYNSGKHVTNFKMDYKLLNNIINENKFDSLTYNIYISNIDKIDNTEIYNQFSSVFEK